MRQPRSSSKRKVCNKSRISCRWHHVCQNFEVYALWKPEKCFLQDLLLSQIIPRKLNFALPLRELSWIFPPGIIIRTSIIVYLIPHHSSWFKNYKLYWFSNLFPTLLSVVPKQVLLLTQIYSSWWGWWPRATHAPTFVTSSQNFHIKFVKSVIDLKN